MDEHLMKELLDNLENLAFDLPAAPETTQAPVKMNGRIVPIEAVAPEQLPNDEVLEGQTAFIELEESWRAEWQNMPEYVQQDLTPWKSLLVHFASREDLLIFAQLTGQHLNSDTVFMWYPPQKPLEMSDKRYIDQPE